MKDAEQLAKWISTGELTNGWLSAKQVTDLADDVALIKKWRQGFLRSIAVAEAAMQLNSKLTKAETKCIARKIVNGDNTVELTRRAKKALDAYNGLDDVARRTLLRSAGKRAAGLAGIGLIFAFLDAKRGWAGEGEKHPELSGVEGALVEMSYQAMMGPAVEGIVSAAYDNAGKLLPPGHSAERRAGLGGVSGIVSDALNGPQ